MNYGLTSTPHESTCLVIGLFDNSKLPSLTSHLSKEQISVLTRLKAQLTEPSDHTWQADFNGQSLLLIHCGDEAHFSPVQLKKTLTTVAHIILKQKIKSAVIAMPQLAGHTPDWQMQQMVLQFESQRYQFLDFKSKKNKPYALDAIQFYLPNATLSAITTAEAIAAGIRLTRDLANLPANVCTPTHLAAEAQSLASQFATLETTILNQETLREMGMGALLAVARGSIEPPKLVEIQYRGDGNQTAPIILVGKGITFDSGGISIKPSHGMEEMKFDMAGAASVLGTIKACALLKLPIHVIGLLACAENMPSGSAIKPGDVVTSLSGQTIEITNTDAEGRLVLADALTYAERFNPRFVIDIATLTGAVIIALGHVATGLMTKDEGLAKLILSAADISEDKTWRLPLDDAYLESLESPIADMVNSTAERVAGSVTAACFLSKFTEKFRWAHLDIAGTAWVSGKNRCATGRPVPLLVEILRQAAHEN